MNYILEYLRAKKELVNCTNKIYRRNLLKKIYHLRNLIHLEYDI